MDLDETWHVGLASAGRKRDWHSDARYFEQNEQYCRLLMTYTSCQVDFMHVVCDVSSQEQSSICDLFNAKWNK